MAEIYFKPKDIFANDKTDSFRCQSFSTIFLILSETFLPNDITGGLKMAASNVKIFRAIP